MSVGADNVRVRGVSLDHEEIEDDVEALASLGRRRQCIENVTACMRPTSGAPRLDLKRRTSSTPYRVTWVDEGVVSSEVYPARRRSIGVAGLSSWRSSPSTTSRTCSIPSR
jgi:hypothetical protein